MGGSNPRITGLLLKTFSFSIRVITVAAIHAARYGHLETFGCIYSLEPEKCMRPWEEPHGAWAGIYMAEAADTGEVGFIKYILTKFQPPPEVVWDAMGWASNSGRDSALRLLYEYGSKTEDWSSIAERLHKILSSLIQFNNNHPIIWRQMKTERTLKELYNSAVERTRTGPIYTTENLVFSRSLGES